MSSRSRKEARDAKAWMENRTYPVGRNQVTRYDPDLFDEYDERRRRGEQPPDMDEWTEGEKRDGWGK
jgi:hypothetical protein